MKTEVRFEIKEKVKPVFKSKMNVPFPSKELINKELERLEKDRGIKKVYHSDWASTTVDVKKKNPKKVNFNTKIYKPGDTIF